MAHPHTTLVIALPKDFSKTIMAVMEDEWVIASRKWKTHPTKKDKLLTFEHTIKQLKLRVNNYTCQPWELTSPSICIAVPGPVETLQLPSAEASKKPWRFLRNRDGWTVDQEGNDDAHTITALPEAIQQEIIAWARTGVFYGVASYRK